MSLYRSFALISSAPPGYILVFDDGQDQRRLLTPSSITHGWWRNTISWLLLKREARFVLKAVGRLSAPATIFSAVFTAFDYRESIRGSRSCSFFPGAEKCEKCQCEHFCHETSGEIFHFFTSTPRGRSHTIAIQVYITLSARVRGTQLGVSETVYVWGSSMAAYRKKESIFHVLVTTTLHALHTGFKRR